MIDAKTARTLVAESETLIEKYIEDLGKVIEREARLGKSFVFPAKTIGLQFRTLYDVKNEPYRTAEMTGTQKLISERLKKLGFSMWFEKQEVQIGGGLGSMDDEVRHEMHDYIKISW
jgi:hypothetical protein